MWWVLLWLFRFLFRSFEFTRLKKRHKKALKHELLGPEFGVLLVLPPSSACASYVLDIRHRLGLLFSHFADRSNSKLVFQTVTWPVSCKRSDPSQWSQLFA